MKCPGQDSGFWQGNPVVEVPCPVCGWSVEVFRDEAKGRCTHCGHRFPNPGGNFGCAQWCPMAKECLGFVPERPQPVTSTEGAVAARLISRLETVLAAQPDRWNRTLRAFRHAREMVARTGGNPQVVLVATLLAAASGISPETGLASGQADRLGSPCSPLAVPGSPLLAPGSPLPASSGRADPLASQWSTWLAELRLAPAATEQIRAIVEGLHAGTSVDSPEYRIVHAACVRADGPDNGPVHTDPSHAQARSAASQGSGQPPRPSLPGFPQAGLADIRRELP